MATSVDHFVSILIPAFNAERWVGEAIDSALAQTWSGKEVIVVDDGSTDGTLQVAREFKTRGVRVIAQANRGAAVARNTALRAAKGSYIQFLDADDLLHRAKIEAQLRGAEDGWHSRVLLTCRWGRFYGRRPDRASFEADSLWRNLRPEAWMIAKFSENRFMVPASWLVSRRLIEAAGPWNERLSLDDDGEYVCRLVAASRRVRFVPEATCYYRTGNPGSLSAQYSRRALESSFSSLRLCTEHLLRLENSETTRSACVQLLQDNIAHFYPEQTDLVRSCRDLAHSLGGVLRAPQERAHFRLFRRVFGWRAAKGTRRTLNNTKMRIRRVVAAWHGFGAQVN